MLSTLLTAVAIALAGLAIILLLVWRGQERMVFQPPAYAARDVRDAVRVDFRAPDGQPLFYYRVGPDSSRAEAPLLLVFHGNAEVAAWGIEWAGEVTRRTGARVVLAEYRGYAGLPGSPTYASSRTDARATWEAVRSREGVAAVSQVVLYGHSLGSAIAIELATEIGPRAVLLEAPFTSAKAMAGRMLIPGLTLFWRVLSRVHYDTRTRVASLDAPVWVIHGARDGVVPVRMGREVHAAAKVKGELVIVPDAGHNDIRVVAGETYWRWLGSVIPQERSER